MKLLWLGVLLAGLAVTLYGLTRRDPRDRTYWLGTGCSLSCSGAGGLALAGS